MKLIKWLVISMLAIGICAVLYLTLFFNINDFKPQIVDAVKKQTGRTLTINQDLSWSFYPSIGIKVGAVSFSNPDSFQPQQMLEINQAIANVALMPLLRQEIEIDQLSLDGLTVNLVTDNKGKTSFYGLGEDKQTTITDTQTSNGHAMALSSLNIGGISITNMKVNIIDQQAKTEQHFTLNSFTLGQFSLGQFADIAYEFEADLAEIKLSSTGKGQVKVSDKLDSIQINQFAISNNLKGESLPKKSLQADLVTDVVISLNNKDMTLTISELTLDNIEANAKVALNYANTVPVIKLDIELGDIDLDSLLPKSAKTTEDGAEAVSTESDKEPDLSALKQVDLTVNLKAKSIKVNNLLTQNWQMNTVIKQGVVNLKKLSADLYTGNITVTAKIDARKNVPTYQFDNHVTEVQIRPLLTDLAAIDLISGTANFSVKGKGTSLIPSKFKQQLIADGQFEIADGSLYGVNIPQMIRSAQKKMTGDLSAQDDQELKTDFTSLTGSFNLLEGVINNSDLSMSSPLVRLDGKGTANIISQQIEYQLNTKVVGSLAGQGSEQDSLQGVDIPLSISGSFQDPKFGLDTDALLKGRLDQEKDKLKDRLFKKLGGL
ncbi:AsmA family protein [Shewanella sp. OMA3-2]|uniref:AsmA family protein n=1 Tax=Shewanella sp. OMA3-2 TaxID=2908650 RepID=UPI001F167F99|nr:AsmA family protein [Shewanella sp. OMA3-2]UJF20734.1 AsmA family protein [Shewanella sp. OMA3-2]